MAQPTHFGNYTCVVTDIDRKRYGKRVVPMKVLMLGMGRTATESTCAALRLLGINECYHGWQPIFDNPRDNEMWLEAIEAKFDGKGKPYGRAEFDKLLGHCQGVSDIPAILFAEELIAAYPEAKVILTHRNFDTWYKSCLETLDYRITHPISKGVMGATKYLRMYIYWNRPVVARTWEIMFDGDFKKNARSSYERHYAHVRSLVPKDRLLEYHVQDGWEPLCKFLHVDHPEIEFPRGNDTKAMNKRLEVFLLMTCMAILRRLAFLGIGCVLLGYASLFLYRNGLPVLR